MQSISKTPVSLDAARRIAADAFDGAELAAYDEITDGWFNAAYAHTLADGRRAVLKVSPLPQVEVAVRTPLIHRHVAMEQRTQRLCRGTARHCGDTRLIALISS